MVYSIYKVGPVASTVTNLKKNIVTNDPTQLVAKQFSNASGDFVSKSMAQVSNIETHQKIALKNEEVQKFGHKVSRNDPCPCGAIKEDGTPIKYKNCCGK